MVDYGVGDIWKFHANGNYIVITTNIGWKRDGTNPMGAGIAKQAAKLYPQLPTWYGSLCMKEGHNSDALVTLYEPGKMFLFPTKPLNKNQPWLSWRNQASLDLIAKSAIQLNKIAEQVAAFPIVIPLVGCENGGLSPDTVVPVLKPLLDDRFLLIRRA